MAMELWRITLYLPLSLSSNGKEGERGKNVVVGTNVGIEEDRERVHMTRNRGG
jgi:hypothetical protein